MGVRQIEGIDPVWLAQSLLRRHKLDECIELCTDLLGTNPYDQAVWYLKCRALTLKAWIDDTDWENDGELESVLDEAAVADAPRPGTSLQRPNTQAGAPGTANPGVRPMTASGRPLTGFARPGTASRPTSAQTLESALQGPRPFTARPTTASGRFVRLGTASMLGEKGGAFIVVDRLDLRKYASRPSLSRALFDYLIHVEAAVRRALELAAHATAAAEFGDWWWKARLGKCYLRLGMLRDAERQLRSALANQDMVLTTVELAKVHMRLDQPTAAIDSFMKALEKHPGDTTLLLGIARIHDALNNLDKGVSYYKKVLHYDASNVEAIACLAGHHFYNDQPEMSLRFYRRLLQMGVSSTELWNNLGLCCFYASQYDMALSCFERALALASDDNMGDVWYNIGQIAIGIGDLGLAYQSFKIAVSVDNNHYESFNNLGVLELRKGNIEAARASFSIPRKGAPHMFEPFYNGGLLAQKLGNFQESHDLVVKALQAYPGHTESQEILKQLRQQFNMW